MAERIVRLIDYLKETREILSQAEFAEKIGTKPSQVSEMLSGKRIISERTLRKISQTFPSVSYNWLLEGRGEMLKVDNADLPTINYEKRGVPYFDVDFIGGFDIVLNDQTINPLYYIDFKQYNAADYWVNVSGHSMSPEVSNGDMVAIKELNDWPLHLLYGEMYALITSENRTIKYVRRSNKGDDYLRLVPVNTEKYDEQDIPASIIRKVFKVLGCAKKIQ